MKRARRVDGVLARQGRVRRLDRALPEPRQGDLPLGLLGHRGRLAGRRRHPTSLSISVIYIHKHAREQCSFFRLLACLPMLVSMEPRW